MPTERPTRRRGRRASGLTPAELTWLDGEPRGRAGFGLFVLTDSNWDCHLDRADEVLDQAAGLVPDSRIAELRQSVAKRRERVFITNRI